MPALPARKRHGQKEGRYGEEEAKDVAPFGQQDRAGPGEQG
jgi:hypothetical protein